MSTSIAFDPAIGRQFLKYARLVAGRGSTTRWATS